MKERWIRYARLVSAAAVLAVLAYFGALMSPPYFRNLEFQRALERISAETDAASLPPEVVRTAVLDQAGRLGLPVRAPQVQVARSADRYAVEVRYFVRVDLPLYTVDLHFRPRAGR